jgi:hypothetical protein
MKKYKPISERKAIVYFPSLDRFQTSIYKSMFAKDIHLSIVPIGGSSRNYPGFKAIFNGNPDDIEIAKKVCASLGRSSYRQKNENELVCTAIDDIAQNIGEEGIAYYELVYENGNVENPILHGFSSKRLIKVPSRYFQIVPKADVPMTKNKINSLKSSSIWSVKPPKLLGKYKGLKRTLNKLEKIIPFGSTPRKDVLDIMQQKSYDVKLYDKTLHVLINQITSIWGWNRRSMDVEHTTEYYSFYKFISFKYSQAILREHILREMNGLFLSLGINCKVKITDIPSSKDLAALRSKLLNGDVSFEDINKRVSLL